MHRSVLTGSPANLAHELLCLYPVTDTQPGTEKVSDNGLTTKWVNGQLLEKYVCGIHFLEKKMGSSRWWGEECPILCSCSSLFCSGSLLNEIRSLLGGLLSQVVTTQLFVQRPLETLNREMRLARVWQFSRLTEEDKRVRARTTGCLRRFPLRSRQSQARTGQVQVKNKLQLVYYKQPQAAQQVQTVSEWKSLLCRQLSLQDF